MRSILPILAATFFALAVSACSLSPSGGGLPTPVSPATPSALPLSPTWTLTPLPSPSTSATPSPGTPTVLPTETPLPPATLPPGNTRVSFPGEGTEAIETGQVSAGTVQYYVLAALQGQEMMVSLDSPNHDLVLGIYGSSDGTWLLTPTQSQATFQGPLPESEDYVIEVAPANGQDSFSLAITIASTIVLQPGSSPLTVTGTAQDAPLVTYLLPVKAGQTLTLDLQSKSKSAVLVLYGLQDGQPIVTLSRHATHFNGGLPASQDYVLQVVQGSAPSDFTLKMKIS